MNGEGLTMKEWLQRIEDTVNRVEVKIDAKASLVDMKDVDARVTELSKEIGKIKVRVYAILASVGVLATVGEIVRQGVLK